MTLLLDEKFVPGVRSISGSVSEDTNNDDGTGDVNLEQGVLLFSRSRTARSSPPRLQTAWETICSTTYAGGGGLNQNQIT